MPSTPTPRLLADLCEVAAAPAGRAGALWKLTESGRQLDANLVHLPAHRRVERHVEPELDVLVLVLGGQGTLHALPAEPAAGRERFADRASPADRENAGDPAGGEDPERLSLTEGVVCWLPHGSARAIEAGPAGLTYLTVHRRRPGLRIAARPAP